MNGSPRRDIEESFNSVSEMPKCPTGPAVGGTLNQNVGRALWGTFHTADPLCGPTRKLFQCRKDDGSFRAVSTARGSLHCPPEAPEGVSFTRPIWAVRDPRVVDLKRSGAGSPATSPPTLAFQGSLARTPSLAAKRGSGRRQACNLLRGGWWHECDPEAGPLGCRPILVNTVPNHY